MEASDTQSLGRVFSNSGWVFLTLILFVCYVMLLAGLPGTALHYFTSFLIICLLFSPVLVFAFFRNWLIERTTVPVIAGLWSLAFIGYPVFLLFVAGDPDFPDHPFFREVHEFGTNRFLLTLSITLLLTELSIQFNDHLKQLIGRHKWMRQFSLEKSILGVCLLLSVMLAFIGMWEVRDAGGHSLLFRFFQFFSFTFQFFLILLAYYFFYYCNHYFLIPRILKVKGVVYYGFGVAAVILICYPVFVGFIRWLPIVDQLTIGLFIDSRYLFAQDGGGIPFTIMLLSLPIIISNQWFKQHRAIAELEKEKTEGELGLLKQQINPHFFFNTLNNLYALSLTQDKATPEMILQLSELMRYVIYRGKEPEVKLEEEIKYIEDYVQLQRIRLHRQLDYCFEKQISDRSLKIPPLFFIILVENAFKHGIEPAERESLLHLQLECDGQRLRFSCRNSRETQNAGPKGIGLDNLRRRLELLFPNKHELIIRQEANYFTAILKLDLS